MALRFKVDEDLPVDVAGCLREAGHDARTVIDQQLIGTTDEELWPIVQAERRCLVTADKAFANAAERPPGSHAGIVLLRHPRESRRGYVALTQSLIAHVDLSHVVGVIAVVSPDGIRIHRGD